VADARRPLARRSAWANQAPKITRGNTGGRRLFIRTSAFGKEQPELALVDAWARECSQRAIAPLTRDQRTCSTARFQRRPIYGPEGRFDMPTASECRQHAKECLQLASTAVNFYVQAALTELAGDFQEMAAIRERTKPADPR